MHPHHENIIERDALRLDALRFSLDEEAEDENPQESLIMAEVYGSTPEAAAFHRQDLSMNTVLDLSRYLS